ncbi:hypothetical protein [Plantactinospora sp. B24E8]|uniref:hypothetical protein n=1 Tax=Plantactinospora sp. B24E8 TaxID=3153567 RepID=UPI00325E4503
MDLACDESGSEGERLVGGVTDVFAHASVRLPTEVAAECVQELRRQIRSPATEYKANHLLREKNRRTLVWLFGPSGPILGQARVHLTDKEFFVVRRIVDLLVDDADHAASLGLCQGREAWIMAVTLYREGRRGFPRDRWNGFLEAFNYLLRPRNRRGVWLSVDDFYQVVNDLRGRSAGPAEEILGLLPKARARLESVLEGLLDRPGSAPALNPIIPAIVSAVAYWGADGVPVSIVHDIQTALTAEHVGQLRQLFGGPGSGPLTGGPGRARLSTVPGLAPAGRLAGLTFVESHLDPRVQVADFLAGTARRIASDTLNRRGDPELVGLLRPYVDPASIWADEPSWSALAPAPVSRPGSCCSCG